MIEPTTTLYERLGGPEGVGNLIDRFYAKVVADPVLEPFFRNSSVERIRTMQREFFGAALDGPVVYTGLSLAQSHAGRGITPHHFSRYVGLLLETLQEIGVDRKDVSAVVDRISMYADEITGQSTTAG
jgi:hemoglobin